MIDVDWKQVPGAILVILGLFIAVDTIVGYAQFVMDPPSHRLGFLTELVSAGILLFAISVIGIGIWGYRRQRAATPLAVIVWFLALQSTFWIDLYSISQNTQFTDGLGLLVATVPAVAAYVFARRVSR